MSSASEPLVPILLLLALHQRPQAEEGTERANAGTASLCGKATEKVAPEARPEARSQDTFSQDPGR